ncbi:MAG TPA: glycine cleavage system protein GcvH [candidate division WOR-3 bacterium]|uniref:Glycine cleavage system H protein n=1 Tax=candidate division WOR-3 bacterium TaxID=2052148 RepID=A0A7V0LUW6_UNCW3|nr:glycine cleavage system protein GcvH [Candidatus Hydrothermae bacterium]RKY98122.1 MAG: glycine cleavage system protein GcvH [Candidatus Hydrothermae bacterium]HDL60240.1 glycine cleavage system protein GcvH [candidate division WOR-3 bacterium]
MKVPEELKYTEEHEWVKVEGDIAIVGITDFAQNELSDIVYVELPEVGKNIKKGDVIATVEAVKTVADVYSPVSGEIIEVNEKLKDEPSIINNDPYGEGWIAKVKMENPEEINALLDHAAYKKLVEEE